MSNHSSINTSGAATAKGHQNRVSAFLVGPVGCGLDAGKLQPLGLLDGELAHVIAVSSPGAGQGLASMQARANSIGASLVLVPRDGGGTVVRLHWPD